MMEITRIRPDSVFKYRDIVEDGIAAIYKEPRGVEREYWCNMINGALDNGAFFLFTEEEEPVGWMYVNPYQFESGELAIHLTHWYCVTGKGRSVLEHCWDKFIDMYARPMGAKLLTGKTPHDPRVYERMMRKTGFKRVYTEFHAEID
jgi:hypothetical protein